MNVLKKVSIAVMFGILASPTMAQDINLSNYTNTFYAPFPSLGYIQDCQGKVPCYLTPGHTWISAIPNGFGLKDYSALSVGGTLGPGLHITATKDPTTGKWSSGSVSTCDDSVPTKGFYQGGGYFEAKIRQPVSNGQPTGGSGVWTAFWMTTLKAIGTMPYPPSHELDVFEYYGGVSPPAEGSIQDGFHTSWHMTDASGVHTAMGVQRYSIPSQDVLSSDFHLYGIDIEPDFTTWYFDRHPVWQVQTASAFLVPQCIYIDYALGGNFPLTGVISGSHMDIAEVTAYKHK
jgi:hypothetical protein